MRFLEDKWDLCKTEPNYTRVTERTVFRATHQIPYLGLALDESFGFRVYALECQPAKGDTGPYIYVGIAHKDNIGKRIRVEWEQKRSNCGERAADYCMQHKPKRVLLVWPAPNRAVEAYVYFALLALQSDKGRVHSLGGWAQTSVNPSRLQLQQYEQGRRLLRCRCFNCGGSHLVYECKKPLEGITYPCPSPTCDVEIVVSSRGETLPTTRPTARSCHGGLCGACAAPSARTLGSWWRYEQQQW